MSLRRSIAWSAALADLRRDRSLNVEIRAAHCRREAFAHSAASSARRALRDRPLVVSGRFDRKAIMAAATATAKARQGITGEAWGVCMSAALKGVWSVAKAARLSRAH